MKIILTYVFILGSFILIYVQSYGGYNPYNYGAWNYASGSNSFKYYIIGSNQDKTGPPVGIVSAIVRRVLITKIITDRFGNMKISPRWRNSVSTAGDKVLRNLVGVAFHTPPLISVNQVEYLEKKV